MAVEVSGFRGVSGPHTTIPSFLTAVLNCTAAWDFAQNKSYSAEKCGTLWPPSLEFYGLRKDLLLPGIHLSEILSLGTEFLHCITKG